MYTIKYILTLGISFLLCLFTACEKTEDKVESTEPQLVSMSPKTAKEGTIITILGRNFSSVREDNIVKFNGVPAVVLEASKGELKVIVPDNGTDGVVTITVGDKVLTGPAFTYEVPGVEYLVKTLAGSDDGFVDGTGPAALFSSPEGVAVDANGNLIVTDRANNSIRKVTPAGVVSTIVGNGTKGSTDGPVAIALLNLPWKSAIDAQGNIYVADRDNHRIRKITPAGVVSTLAGSTSGYADGTGTAAKFNQPLDVAVDAAGNVYVADNNNHRIRKISPAGVVTTLAGSTIGNADGTGADAQFRNPSGLDVDANGNVYVADRNNHRIRKITPNGEVTTVAGTGSTGRTNGAAAQASFNQPYGIAITSTGELIVADLVNNLIRRIDVAGEVTTVAGTVSGFADGAGGSARFNQPTDVAVTTNGIIYVSDLGNDRIRKITIL